MSKKHRIITFICAHDGISGHYAGAGTATRGYLRGIPLLKNKLQSKNIKLTCFAITGDYTSDSYGYNKKLLSENQSICRNTGGEVLFCLNNSNGTYQYGDLTNWNVASVSAATICHQTLIKSAGWDKVVVVAVDTPFAFVPMHLSRRLATEKEMTAVWIPHSTSLIHERGHFDAKRLHWESQTIEYINSTNNFFVGYLNSFMRDHLEEMYGAKRKKLVPVLNGIDLSRVPSYSSAEITNTLKKYHIPADKPLIISFGRLAPYKGYDTLLRAARILNNLPVHFVLQVAPFSPRDPFINHLRRLAQPLKNITFITELNYDLPRKLMQWKNTEIVAVLSKNEPGSFIPAEARIYQQPIVLVSDRDGLPCQVTHGINGFITPLDVTAVAKTIEEIYFKKQEDKKIIRKAGRDLTIAKYNIIENFVQGLLKVI